MSGAEVIAVLGVISSVIAIVDGTKKVYDAASDTHGLPKAFREVVNRLAVVRHILELIKTDIEDGDVDENVREAVKDLVGTCGEKAKELNEIFRKVIPSENASRTRRYHMAVKTLGKGNQVELLMKGMLEDVQLLTSSRKTNAMTAFQAEQVVKAISEMSALRSSVPEHIFEESGFTANSFGPGTQANYHARVEYIAQGSIKQYSSASSANNFTETSNTAHNQNIYNLNSNDQNQSECLTALFLTDPKDDRSGMIYAKGQRAGGTCEWIKTNDLYTSWLISTSQLLWISGGPGKGKTMLSIFLAEELEHSSTKSQGTFIQYFCDNKDAKRNTAITIIRGLIYQLLKAVPSLYRHILPDFEVQKESLFSPSSFEILWRIFVAMVCDTLLGETYCILDGIDECDEASASLLLKKLQELFSKQIGHTLSSHLKVVILSRDLPDFIPESLSSFPRIRLDPDLDMEVNKDIDRFIEAKVDELSMLKDYGSSLRDHVKDTFRKRAQSTFLWVGIVAKELEKYRASEAENALQLFPPGLEALYARMLLQIVPHQRQAAASILRWVVLAIRPLTLSELAVVLSGTLKPSSFFSPKEIVRDQVLSCGCFLSINNDVVGLIHQSAKDYLLRAAPNPNLELEVFRVVEYLGNLELAEECLRYLENGWHQVFQWDRLEKIRPSLEPFLEYAICYWFIHARSLSSGEEIFDLSRPFFKKAQLWTSWIKIYNELNLRMIFPHEEFKTLLHIASAFGIVPIVHRLVSWKHRVKHPFYVKKGDTGDYTALFMAVYQFEVAIVQILIANGAAVNAKTLDVTALHIAVCHESEVMVRLLIDGGANIEAKDYSGRPPLFDAVQRCYINIAQLLLDMGANLKATCFEGRTALIEVCVPMMPDCGQHLMVGFLIDKGINIEAKSEDGCTALIQASLAGYKDAVETLLIRGANIEARDKNGSTALIQAATGRRIDVVEVLLEKGADIEAEDNEGRTAVQVAASSMRGRSSEVVQLLLDHGAIDTRPKPTSGDN